MTVAAPRTDRLQSAVTAGPEGAVFAQVEVCANPLDALAVWRELAPARCASYYQSEKFLLTWLDHFGAGQKVTPFFIVARDQSGAPLALLPLGLFHFGPLRVAQFLGGKHSNYNLGLFRAGLAFSAHDLRLLLREAARVAQGPHLYRLLNMPLLWKGAPNPLTLLPHRLAASRAYATALGADGEAWLAARLSADTRKKLRKKEKRLAGMGALRYFRAASESEAKEALDAYFEQRSPLMVGDEAGTRAFFDSLTTFERKNGLPPAELHVLALDGRIIATLAAGLSGERLQGMFISFDADPEIAKSSPGQILLVHVLRDACARKIAAFDLGTGDARYKTTFCNEVEILADALFAVSFLGWLTRPFFAAGLAAKATIKRNPRLWALAERFRRR